MGGCACSKQGLLQTGGIQRETAKASRLKAGAVGQICSFGDLVGRLIPLNCTFPSSPMRTLNLLPKSDRSEACKAVSTGTGTKFVVDSW